MSRRNSKPPRPLLERVLDEASWLLSHAQALADYGREEEAAAERARAGAWEEQAACLLEADGQAREAAIHRVSAASCYEKLGQYGRAVTLLSAALAADLPEGYRARVEGQRVRCVTRVRKELTRALKKRAGKQSPAQP
jgi:hypothetical protein